MTENREDGGEPIVLAYSGSAATTAAVRWLGEKYAADVVTLTLDLGAGGELQEIHERALAIGAVRAHVIDVREEFADGYLLPALQAGALHPGGHSPQTLARPLIARKLVEIARIERATTVAHGGTSDCGLDTLIHALAPDLRIIGRAEGPTLDNGADVEITFDRDVPVAINGVPMSLTELIESLTVIATQHGYQHAKPFAGAPAIAVLQAAFNARHREETTCVVRLKLQHGATIAAAVPSAQLAAPRS